MALTQTMLDDLEAAYFAGVLTIRHLDKTLTYASLDDLWQAILRLRQELAPASQKAPISGLCGYRRY